MAQVQAHRSVIDSAKGEEQGMRRKSAMAKLAASMASIGLLAATGPMTADAGKAVPFVYISNCQISKSGGVAGSGSVTASGGWSGIRAGAIVSVEVAVWQVANEGAGRLAYSSSSYMTMNVQSRTGGFLDAAGATPHAWTGYAGSLQAGFATAQIRINLPRSAQNASDLLSCTVVE
jgi:hypothetical protein